MFESNCHVSDNFKIRTRSIPIMVKIIKLQSIASMLREDHVLLLNQWIEIFNSLQKDIGNLVSAGRIFALNCNQCGCFKIWRDSRY